MFEYEDDILAFVSEVESFVDQHELPEQWFTSPDHLAIKCADGLDYVFRMEELLPDSIMAAEVQMDERRLATLQLTSSIEVGRFGAVSWLEVMEPRPAKVGAGLVGLEHIEFCYPKFDEVTSLLDERGVQYSMQSNKGHSWINIVINDLQQEIKINDKLISEVVDDEVSRGEARLLG